MLRLLLLLCTVVICWSAVCFCFGYGYGRKSAVSFGRGFGYGHNWTSVMAPLSAKAETRKTGFGSRSLSVMSAKARYQLPYPDLEPGNEFWYRFGLLHIIMFQFTIPNCCSESSLYQSALFQ